MSDQHPPFVVRRPDGFIGVELSVSDQLCAEDAWQHISAMLLATLQVEAALEGREFSTYYLVHEKGWIDGSGEYRSQAWMPLPDGRVLRIMSGEEPDEPDYITDIYDPKGTPWDIRYYKPRTQ